MHSFEHFKITLLSVSHPLLKVAGQPSFFVPPHFFLQSYPQIPFEFLRQR
jgi:hypothetical protein